jgi:hypothetical protein
MWKPTVLQSHTWPCCEIHYKEEEPDMKESHRVHKTSSWHPPSGFAKVVILKEQNLLLKS